MLSSEDRSKVNSRLRNTRYLCDVNSKLISVFGKDTPNIDREFLSSMLASIGFVVDNDNTAHRMFYKFTTVEPSVGDMVSISNGAYTDTAIVKAVNAAKLDVYISKTNTMVDVYIEDTCLLEKALDTKPLVKDTFITEPLLELIKGISENLNDKERISPRRLSCVLEDSQKNHFGEWEVTITTKLQPNDSDYEKADNFTVIDITNERR